VLLLDLMGSVVWVYALVKLAIIDIDRILLEAAVPGSAWILDYRALLFLLAVCLTSIFLWRWLALAAIGYVLFFPLVIVFWKVPALIIRRKLYRGWLMWMVVFNGLVNFVRNLRYYLVSKSLLIIVVLGILFMSNKYVLIFSAIILLLLLAWAIERILFDTFRTSWFLRVQKRALDTVTSWILKPEQRWSAEILAKRDEGTLNSTELQNVASRIQLEIVANQFLYYWAYKLRQYSQSQLSFLFNSFSYGLLFLGSVLVFWLLNLALLKVEPGQFAFDDYPSRIAMLLYSLSSLVLNDGGGVSPQGDLAFILRVIAGFYGIFFLSVFVVNLLFTYRGAREDTELRSTVEDLRERAKAHEAEFRAALQVSFDEACDRLLALGLGTFVMVIRLLKSAVPPDFARDADF
jgi:hypothetical protein